MSFFGSGFAEDTTKPWWVRPSRFVSWRYHSVLLAAMAVTMALSVQSFEIVASPLDVRLVEGISHSSDYERLKTAGCSSFSGNDCSTYTVRHAGIPYTYALVSVTGEDGTRVWSLGSSRRLHSGGYPQIVINYVLLGLVLEFILWVMRQRKGLQLDVPKDNAFASTHAAIMNSRNQKR